MTKRITKLIKKNKKILKNLKTKNTMKETLENINEIIKIAKIKNNYDQNGSWLKGSKTFFEEIKKEIIEAEQENKPNRKIYLEDELGDIFWDYIHLLINLQNENKIKLENVFKRCNKKFSERTNAILNNINWSEIKKKQKQELKIKQEKLNKKTKKCLN
jgi:NTP pyrophosphatase (non-canonical NTP hydrolase)